MRKVIFTTVLACGVLSGCSTTHREGGDGNGILANPIITKPTIMQTDPSKADYQLAYGNNARVQTAYEHYLKTGKAPNIITKGFEQFAYGASQPIIDISPFELTAITLEKGEHVNDVNSGDPSRLSYVLTYSGQGNDRQAHVLVKPTQPDLSSNMVITTDKRLYTLKIVSTNNGKYLRNVNFWYPDEIQRYWDNYNAKQGENGEDPVSIAQLPDIHLNQLNFKYNIDAPFFSSPRWKPTRVFDDGVHTYIQFPDTVSSGDLPALFILDSSSDKKELVNYRVKKPYFIVDKIFKKAVLVLGVGSSQTKVTIINESM